MRKAGLALLLALAVPASASAQTPPPPAPTPTPPPAAPPAPVAATLSTSTLDTFDRARAAFVGRSFTARVVMKPFVANETAVIRVYRGKKKIQVKTLKFTAVDNGAAGVATIKVKSGKPGSLAIKVSHKATATVSTLRAKTLRVNVVNMSAGIGSRGPAVRFLQSKLASLHYVTSTGGVYDAATSRAVMAFRKVTGMSRVYTASADVFRAMLAGRGKFKVRHPGDGRHVEARLNQQVLALINGNKVERIYHTSSGKPSTPTVQGKFRVYMKTPGTNAKGMVDSSYFIRGYAIHGYADVPAYNASHGCLRVPVPNARSIYDWLRIGDVVWVEP
jgi:peptidoglycan hydrolase-like protein with peptidoglycan-binding domain